jgi:hypothetical protein
MQSLPPNMCKGSKGPHVSILHAFFCGMVPFHSAKALGKELQFDAEYGNVTEQLVADLRVDLGPRTLPKVDGNFDKKLRATLKTIVNFDFETLCETIPGTTYFVQPDGSTIIWTSPAQELPRSLTGEEDPDNEFDG